jgi:hypothetical protein
MYKSMKINHLNESSKMTFKNRDYEKIKLVNSEREVPLMRICVDGTFNIELTSKDIADILISKGFEAPICFEVKNDK